MKSFEVTVLGANSAIPAFGRHPSAQIVNVHDKFYLVDCGEGTQMRMKEYDIKPARIEAIFISHLHGDHFFGLMGLLTSYHLLGRPSPLHIYGPKRLKEVIDLTLDVSETGDFSYELNFHPIDEESRNGSSLIFENEELQVFTLPLNHSIDTTGFIFKEKQEGRKMKGDKLKEYNISYDDIPDLRAGKDVKGKGGTVIANETLTEPPPPPRQYVYCSDTCYHPPIIENIKDADLLYHEATFSRSERERAAYTLHSTPEDAATLAKKANVRQLMIGHYSAKYRQLDSLLEEAQSIFENTILAREGETVTITHRTRTVQKK